MKTEQTLASTPWQVMEAVATWAVRDGLPIRRRPTQDVAEVIGRLFWECDEDYRHFVIQWDGCPTPVRAGLADMRNSDSVHVDACDDLWAAMPLASFLQPPQGPPPLSPAAGAPPPPLPYPFRDCIPPRSATADHRPAASSGRGRRSARRQCRGSR
jgi:hypothetical protein